jgi:dCTP deaminase
MVNNVDVGNIDISSLIGLTDTLPSHDGIVVIPPKKLVLVRTLEHVRLPIQGKLAARVEGRSKQARLGMTIHLTAPTIHAGFGGKIVLEIINHGPFHLEVVPNETKLCQLIFERVGAVPRLPGSVTFSEQTTPLGTPPRRRRN